MSVVNEIQVFSQTRSKRVLVGKLWRSKGKYFFEYDKSYQKMKNALPLAPEFDLWKSKFSSAKFFPSLEDRIPSKNNPAYPDYCRQWGIHAAEQDKFVLLTTIGKKGPSTFVFEPLREKEFSGDDIRVLRQRLDLIQSEFEKLIGIAHATLVHLENSKSKNDFYLDYLKMLAEVPEALKWLIKERGQYLHDEKRFSLLKKLSE